MGTGLEIAILLASFVLILLALGTIGVGVWVLVRTAAIKGLEAQVDSLSDLVQTYRSRATRRAASGKKEATPSAEGSTEETSGIDLTASDFERKKAAIYAEHLRKRGA